MLAGLILAVLLQVPPGASTPNRPTLSIDMPFIDLMADPRAVPLLMRYAPKYIQLIEQQVVPPPASDLTLRDFASIPATEVGAQDLEALQTELSKLPLQP